MIQLFVNMLNLKKKKLNNLLYSLVETRYMRVFFESLLKSALSRIILKLIKFYITVICFL